MSNVVVALLSLALTLVACTHDWASLEDLAQADGDAGVSDAADARPAPDVTPERSCKASGCPK